MLIVYDLAPVDRTYEDAVETIHAMGEVFFLPYQKFQLILDRFQLLVINS